MPNEKSTVGSKKQNLFSTVTRKSNEESIYSANNTVEIYHFGHLEILPAG